MPTTGSTLRSRLPLGSPLVCALLAGFCVWLFPVTGPFIALAMVVGAVPSTYNALRRTSDFDFASFRGDGGLPQVAGWVGLGTALTGVPAILVGWLAHPVAAELPGLFAVVLVIVLTGPITFLGTWRLVVRLNPEYRTDQESQPS